MPHGLVGRAPGSLPWGCEFDPRCERVLPLLVFTKGHAGRRAASDWYTKGTIDNTALTDARSKVSCVYICCYCGDGDCTAHQEILALAAKLALKQRSWYDKLEIFGFRTVLCTQARVDAQLAVNFWEKVRETDHDLLAYRLPRCLMDQPGTTRPFKWYHPAKFEVTTFEGASFRLSMFFVLLVSKFDPITWTFSWRRPTTLRGLGWELWKCFALML